MENVASLNAKSSTVALATFYVGDALCGMDILTIQEINKMMDMTIVPHAPDYVMGILNLRGHIITVIDIGKKFLTVEETGDEHRIAALIELLRPYGILEIARTGRIALSSE